MFTCIGIFVGLALIIGFLVTGTLGVLILSDGNGPGPKAGVVVVLLACLQLTAFVLLLILLYQKVWM